MKNKIKEKEQVSVIGGTGKGKSRFIIGSNKKEKSIDDYDLMHPDSVERLGVIKTEDISKIPTKGFILGVPDDGRFFIKDGRFFIKDGRVFIKDK